MRKITIIEHISLDGVIEHDGDYAYGAWTVPYRSPAGLEAVIEAYGTSFDVLLGRELAFVSTKSTPTGMLLNTYRHVGHCGPECLI